MTLEESIDNFTSEIQHIGKVPEALVLVIAPIGWGKTALVQPILDTITSIRHRAGLEHSSYLAIVADGIPLGDDAEIADMLIVTKTGLG